jgi:heme-degrading monooxygenase HmoA
VESDTGRSDMQEVLTKFGRKPAIIGRIWTGRTRTEVADEYLDYLYEYGVKTVEAKPGCLGMQLFRTIRGEIAEFKTISYWESVEAMHQMHSDAGDVLRVHHLEKDPQYLLELPDFVELTELHANDWTTAGS